MPTDNSSAETSSEKAPRPAPGQRKWSHLSAILKIGVTLLILGLVVRSVDLSSAWDHIANQNLPLVVLAGIVLVFQVGLGGTRWFIILRRLDAKPSLWETLKLFYVSVFFNSYVWGGIGGDLARACWGLRRRSPNFSWSTSRTHDALLALWASKPVA